MNIHPHELIHTSLHAPPLPAVVTHTNKCTETHKDRHIHACAHTYAHAHTHTHRCMLGRGCLPLPRDPLTQHQDSITQHRDRPSQLPPGYTRGRGWARRCRCHPNSNDSPPSHLEHPCLRSDTRHTARARLLALLLHLPLHLPQPLSLPLPYRQRLRSQGQVSATRMQAWLPCPTH
jgi:hypothetical protein